MHMHGIPSDDLSWKPCMDVVGEDFSTKDDGDRTALILSHACRNCHILSIINSMWSARF